MPRGILSLPNRIYDIERISMVQNESSDVERLIHRLKHDPDFAWIDSASWMDIEHFIGLLSNHLQRLRIAFPQVSSFLDRYFGSDQIISLAPGAVEKMRLTQSDGEHHSFDDYDRAVYCLVSTLPLQLDQLVDWFVHRYGGYLRFLERMWNAPHFPEDCLIFCHIIYGLATSGSWVQMAIWPLKVSAPIETIVLPVEFLTPEERQKAGL